VHFVKFRENTPCTSNAELDFEDDNDDLHQECFADHGTRLMCVLLSYVFEVTQWFAE